MSLTYIVDEITIYFGSSLLVAGVFGNLMTIIMFSSVRKYRTIPSTFYYIAGSIANIVYILVYLTTRITTSANGIDLTRTSIVWCKARSFAAGSLGPISFSCTCLASIDQYIITSHKVNIRRLSNIKWAHRILFIVIIFWFIHGSISTIFYNITPIRCYPTNPIYDQYVNVYILLFLCLLPITIMIIFGFLTYKNLRETILLLEEHADRQLANMILIQVLLIMISMIPFGTFYTYRLITNGISKDTNRLLKENLVNVILTLVSYFYYIVS